MSGRMPRRPEPGSPQSASLGTLGELLARHGVATGRPPLAAEPQPAAPPLAPPGDGPDLSRCGKVVVRRERKGHGGKTATVIAGLDLPASDLERVARSLRRGLGCGASVAGEQVLVQGDQAGRVRAWLAARGARRVVVGN
jgi:translation initiation factor 1 (eIF-1/SUI1)